MTFFILLLSFLLPIVLVQFTVNFIDFLVDLTHPKEDFYMPGRDGK